jgi:aspartate kinase
VDRDIAKISVVGIGMQHQTGVAAQMFQALAHESIEVQMIGTSEIKISVVVPRKYCELAVRALHESFLEGNSEIDVAIER